MNQQTASIHPSNDSIFLWDKESEHGFRPWIDFFPARKSKTNSAVIIIPGGGYGHWATHEGEKFAQRFNKNGIHAFVLYYHVAPARYPLPQCDAGRAMRLVRSRAQQFGINPQKLALCGCSAGGHLAASIAAMPDSPDFTDEQLEISCRPDALILCYPVISFGEFRNDPSYRNLLGEDPSEELTEKLSLENAVSKDTPPTFMWHTFEDTAVPVENSLFFAQMLSTHKIPFELHVFPHGVHGLGIPDDMPEVAVWFDLCVMWLKKMGW